MKKRTRQLVEAARALQREAVTRSGNDEPTWLVPQEQIMQLVEALDPFERQPWLT